MRTELARAVREKFTAHLEKMLPQFRLQKGQKIGPRCYLYSWNVAPDLTFFVMLQISTKADEEFTLEVAFSSDGRFPDELLAILPFNFAEIGTRGLASRPAWRVRLGNLWRQNERDKDYWWEVTPRLDHHELAQRMKDLVSLGKMNEMPLEEALARVEPAVASAVEKLTEYGMPFLLEVASHRGVSVNH